MQEFDSSQRNDQWIFLLLSYANEENVFLMHSFLNKFAGGDTQFDFHLFH